MSDRIFLSWDEIGFADFQTILDDACDEEIARPIIARNMAAQRAYEESAGSRTRAAAAVDPMIVRAAAKSIREYVGRRTAALRERLHELDGAYLLGAVAALSAFPDVGAKDPISVPGFLDRELEWLSGLPFGSASRVPEWDDVLLALRTARINLVAESFMPSFEKETSTRLREQSMSVSDLGSTYVPIARDLAQRLVDSAVSQNTSLRSSHLTGFVDATERVFGHHISCIGHIVRMTAPHLRGVSDRPSALHALMRTYDVRTIVDALRLDASEAHRDSIEDLTSHPVPGGERIDLRAKPLLAIADSAILVLPRRIACDRHELLDLAVSRVLRMTGSSPQTYPDLRASMLDEVVAESLERLLPGCRTIVGRDWSLDGTVYERDVVALFDDIAICVETKAPQMVPSKRSGYRDVVNVLRGEIAGGIEQVTSIADALEAGTAVVDGQTIPRVRRAYRLVASLNSWWGIDLAVETLRDAGVTPALDAAILTSADAFVCYEKVFEDAADFIAYLDFRLTHQRRPWIRVSDETELIGGFFTNPSDEWVHRPPEDTHHLVKPTFQPDFDATMRFAYTGHGQRSHWMQRKHVPVITAQLEAWEHGRPDAWMQAYSALARTCLRVQREIESELGARTRSRQHGIRTATLPNRAGRLILLDEPAAIDRRTWNALVTKAGTAPLVCIDRRTRGVLAVRGIDDDACWIDPAWAQALHRRVPVNTVAPSAGGQRSQPRRRSRRSR